MPTLADSTRPIDRGRLQEPDIRAYDPPTNAVPLFATVSSFILCPLPPVVAYPDTIRQFSRDGTPQFRMIPPKTII